MSPKKTKWNEDLITEFTAHGRTYLLAEIKEIQPGGRTTPKLAYVNVSEGTANQVALTGGAAVIDDPQPIDLNDVIRFISHEMVKKEAK